MGKFCVMLSCQSLTLIHGKNMMVNKTIDEWIHKYPWLIFSV